MPHRIAIAVLSALVVLGGAPAAAAHTASDLVAVPAGGPARVTLAPTHGCGGSPTVEVRIRVPVPGAEPVAVDGWTASATPDGAARTVVSWTGGSLPADRAGAFPVAFTAPDEVGTLLLFPAVQRCADGEELAWIGGDPQSQFPAPRLLVLPPDAAPAASLDEVPPDAPGRAQLVEIVDVDGPAATTTSTSLAPPPATTVIARTTVAPALTTPTTAGSAPSTTAPEVADDASGGGGSSSAGLVLVGLVVVVGAAGGALLVRRRR